MSWGTCSFPDCDRPPVITGGTASLAYPLCDEHMTYPMGSIYETPEQHRLRVLNWERTRLSRVERLEQEIFRLGGDPWKV